MSCICIRIKLETTDQEYPPGFESSITAYLALISSLESCLTSLSNLCRIRL